MRDSVCSMATQPHKILTWLKHQDYYIAITYQCQVDKDNLYDAPSLYGCDIFTGILYVQLLYSMNSQILQIKYVCNNSYCMLERVKKNLYQYFDFRFPFSCMMKLCQAWALDGQYEAWIGPLVVTGKINHFKIPPVSTYGL